MSTKTNLPIQFITRMKEILGEDYPLFEASFESENSKGVHLNLHKMSSDILLSVYASEECSFEKLPYGENCFKTTLKKSGSHPLSHAGIIYSQDPGAMMPISALPFKIPEKSIILDMCASPGGKTSQLASITSGNCIIVSNEINAGRNKILQSNIERMGYSNVIVTSMDSEKIAINFSQTFDVILVDAPCSGEGMFRKYPESITEWSVQNVQMCSERQKEIISNVISSLKPGGLLIYSTCTYSPEENEEIVSFIESNFPLKSVVLSEEILKYSSPAIIGNLPYENARHFYPHISYGEGQFLCIFTKEGTLTDNDQYYSLDMKKISSKEESLIRDSLKNNPDLYPGNKLDYYYYNQSIVAIDKNILNNNKLLLRLPRLGIERLFVIAGQFEKNRFIPHHHLFKAYTNYFNNKYDMTYNPDIYKYLKGEEISCELPLNGYGVITYHGAGVGGFKASNGRLKNHYPKGLRNNN